MLAIDQQECDQFVLLQNLRFTAHLFFKYIFSVRTACTVCDRLVFESISRNWLKRIFCLSKPVKLSQLYFGAENLMK